MQVEGTESADDGTESDRIRGQIIEELKSSGVQLPPLDGFNPEGLSLGKYSHSLHYLLTGTTEQASPPLGNAILGGTPIGCDLGQGPARFLNPEQVREAAAALTKITSDELASRFDLALRLGLKIHACDEEEGFEMEEYYFSNLVQYYVDAAANGNAMLLFII